MECDYGGGFSFCGVNIADLGLEYVPENQNTYVYRPAKYTPHEESFDAHEGAYFYGTTVKPKEFSLRCYYEDKHVSGGLMTKIFNLFKRGRTGKLIFDRRPWLWYDATVVDVDETQMSNYKNGMIKISMKAYYPFARSDQTYIMENDPNEEDLIANSAMLHGAQWDTDKDYAEDNPLTLSTPEPIDIYNPGTEDAHTSIEIAGNLGEHGVIITNITTGQSCTLLGLDTTQGADAGKTLIVDGFSGKVLLNTNDTPAGTQYGFLYHDNGFIDIASNYPIKRDFPITWTAGTGGQEGHLITTEIFSQKDVGNPIFIELNGDFPPARLGKAILNNMIIGAMPIGEPDIKVFHIATVTETDEGQIITLEEGNLLTHDFETTADSISYNKLVISKVDPNDTVEITKLRIRFKPTFS